MEKIQNGFRFLYRLVAFVFLTIAFFYTSFRIHFTTKDPEERIAKFSKNGNYFTGIVCRFFNIKIKVVNDPPKDKAGLIVGNHMGFIDILVVNSLMPSLFVTSNEIKETPFLGLLCEMGGCLFVERRSRLNITNELGELVKYLKKGFRVILYPEATSHNGEVILPFKRTLLTSAAHAGVPIYPYCFNYISIAGQPFSLKNRDSVCWYGDISFVESYIRFSSLKEIVVEVNFLEPVYTKPEDDRAKVADHVRDMIVQKFKPVQKS